jgi:pimeloyl-ACP methyl ester carboxylesterase
VKVVFIHGRAQGGKDEDELQAKWERAFDDGLAAAELSRPAGLEIGFPFYGDLLDDLIEQLDSESLEKVVERGVEAGNADVEFMAEFLEEIAAGNGISDKEIYENFDQDATERGPLNWGWIRALAKTLDKSNKLGDMALEKFTRDVFLYLTNRNVRRRIDAVVEPHLSGEPCVVVGHSLGSVVGFNVLRHSAHAVSRYVTVGSPLGVKAVKRRLQRPLAMPPNTGDWYNAMDEDDIVALHPLDNRHFGITPPIKNFTDVDNQTDNQHGIVGYLPEPWVAEAIHGGLVGQ